MLHKFKQIIKTAINNPNPVETFERWVFARNRRAPDIIRPATGDEKALIEKLRSGMRNLPEDKPSSDKAMRKWQLFKQELKNRVLNEDPRNFLSWSIITNNMFYRASLSDWNEMRKSERFSKYRDALVEKAGLNPNPFFRMPSASENAIRQMYHLHTFEKTYGKHIEDMDIVVDFGGGFGNMCKLVHNLGFKGRYIIFDWPEFSLLQEFYLGLSGINAPIFRKTGSGNGIYLVNSFDELKKILNGKSASLLIATWSLSETPVELRDTFFGSFDFDYYLLTYQKNFGGIENAGYFNKLKNIKPDTTWTEFGMRYIRTEKNKYLLGKRK